MRLTRPSLKSSKVSGNRTGLSRGTLATPPRVAAAANSGTAPSYTAHFTSMTFVAFRLQNK